ncbi:ROK family protein [Pedobacter polysacchareus]|uniref:ROK family protein n=1 Tax=Pedobacter polysacchareus TaxID=2861973 RepID=UPI0021068FDB|nr:ROK family protein [Pedobacter polysacchareus]
MTASTKKYRQLRTDVIKHLYYGKMLTLAELSHLTHKSLPLITTMVNNLMADGYVLEYGLAPSTGGRRALTFLLNKEKQSYIIAVAMDQLVTQVVIYDLLNEVRIAAELFPFALNGDPANTETLIEFLKNYIIRSGIPLEQILGLGIGMPGFVNAAEGVNHTFFKIEGQGNLKEHLTKELGLPVFIDNDSSLIALAELKFGVAKERKDVMVVNVGWGIGLGMIINGSLFRGHSGYAGEFSHIPLSQSNKLCACGKQGCLEVDTSLLVLVERAKSQIENGMKSSLELSFLDESKLAGDHFLEAAKAGDPLAVSIMADAAFLIGKGLATLIHIINPELIVLGGRGAIAGKMMMAPIEQAIHEFCIPRLAEHTEIKVSALNTESALLGAATLVIENCNFN